MAYSRGTTVTFRKLYLASAGISVADVDAGAVAILKLLLDGAEALPPIRSDETDEIAFNAAKTAVLIELEPETSAALPVAGRYSREVTVEVPGGEVRLLVQDSVTFSDLLQGTPYVPSGSAATWLTGSAAPTADQGSVGDMYLRTTTGDVYSKTAEAVWTLVANITGPAGADGADGADGENALPMPVRSHANTTDTVTLSDANSIIETTSADAVVETIPLHATTAFDNGTVIGFFQVGAGEISLAGEDDGITFQPPDSLAAAGQYSQFWIRKRATNTWAVWGDTAATTPPGPPDIGTPLSAAVWMVTGHSLSDGVATRVADLATDAGYTQDWQQQQIVGSPIVIRTAGASLEVDPDDELWEGYADGSNRTGEDLDLIAHFRDVSAVGGKVTAGEYTHVLILERHDLYSTVEYSATTQLSRHYYELVREGSPDAVGYLYGTWLEYANCTLPEWIQHMREQQSATAAIASRINQALAYEARADRVMAAPTALALANALAASTGGNTLAGITQGTDEATRDILFSDAVHPSPVGLYLLGCVVYGTIYRRDPRGLAYPEGEVTATQAASLQDIAWQTILEYFEDQPLGEQYATSAEIKAAFVAHLELALQIRDDSDLLASLTAHYSSSTTANPLHFDSAANADFWFPAPALPDMQATSINFNGSKQHHAWDQLPTGGAFTACAWAKVINWTDIAPSGARGNLFYVRQDDTTEDTSAVQIFARESDGLWCARTYIPGVPTEEIVPLAIPANDTNWWHFGVAWDGVDTLTVSIIDEAGDQTVTEMTWAPGGNGNTLIFGLGGMSFLNSDQPGQMAAASAGLYTGAMTAAQFVAASETDTWLVDAGITNNRFYPLDDPATTHLNTNGVANRDFADPNGTNGGTAVTYNDSPYV